RINGMIIRLSMALGNKKSVDDAAFEPSLDAYLQIAPDASKPNPSPVEDADLVRPRLMFKRFVLVFFCFVRPNVNEPMALPVEDADVEIAPHHNPFFSPKLLNWNWDDVIVVPSDDDEPIPLPVEDADVEVRFMFNRLVFVTFRIFRLFYDIIYFTIYF
ncbi:hypothetical protein Tco_0095678, partial [Tanacetum coccineum]